MSKPYGIYDDSGRLLVWVGAPDWTIKIPIPPDTAADTIQDGRLEIPISELLNQLDKETNLS